MPANTGQRGVSGKRAQGRRGRNRPAQEASNDARKSTDQSGDKEKQRGKQTTPEETENRKKRRDARASQPYCDEGHQYGKKQHDDREGKAGRSRENKQQQKRAGSRRRKRSIRQMKAKTLEKRRTRRPNGESTAEARRQPRRAALDANQETTERRSGRKTRHTAECGRKGGEGRAPRAPTHKQNKTKRQQGAGGTQEKKSREQQKGGRGRATKTLSQSAPAEGAPPDRTGPAQQAETEGAAAQRWEGRSRSEGPEKAELEHRRQHTTKERPATADANAHGEATSGRPQASKRSHRHRSEMRRGKGTANEGCDDRKKASTTTKAEKPRGPSTNEETKGHTATRGQAHGPQRKDPRPKSQTGPGRNEAGTHHANTRKPAQREPTTA
ncbi:ribosome-binding protein 1-like [Salvelinus sp. IW2-2015]|uniref:ribosome-binding protein 1-like n=1 Tax=Salvelinus sp. IW2-2015 TaxID=2691554 RepID=UPI0038D40985